MRKRDAKPRARDQIVKLGVLELDGFKIEGTSPDLPEIPICSPANHKKRIFTSHSDDTFACLLRKKGLYMQSPTTSAILCQVPPLVKQYKTLDWTSLPFYVKFFILFS